MASEYKGLYVSFEGDSTKLTAALSQINSASRKAQSELRNVQNALKFDPRNVGLLSSAMQAARSKVEATTQRVKTLRQAQDELAKSGDTTSAAYQKLGVELAKAEAYLKRDQAALVAATTATTGLGRAAAVFDNVAAKAAAMSTTLQGVGSKLTMGVTVPLVAFATASIKSAKTIDTALTGVRKTVDMTEEGYQKLKDGALELSKTQPVSADSILNMEALGAQLGWSNDRLQAFAMTVEGLDIATDMDASTAATNLAQFANITRMAQKDADRYASAIVGLGNHMATTESKISDMAMGMASAGTQAGMSQADILGVAAAAASLGIESQTGGSAFSKTLNEISLAVSQNSGTLQQWASLAHMSVDEFKNAWSTDVTGTFERVIQGMSDVSKNGGDLNKTLADLGITELRQSDFMRRLAGNSDLLTQAIDLSNKSWKENSALQAEVDNRNKSIAAKLETIKNKLVAIATEVGGPLADAALSALDAAQPLISGIENAAKAFSSMSKEEQSAIINTLALTAAAGPALSIAGQVVGVAGNVAGVISKGANVLGTFGAALSATDSATQLAMASTGGLAGKLGTVLNPAVSAAGGIGKVAEAAGVAAPALGGLATGGVMVVVAALAILGKGIYDDVKRQQEFNDAMTQMANSADGISAALAPGARAASDYAAQAHDAAMSTDELREAIKQHNQAIAGIKESAATPIKMLGEYKSVIDSMGGQGVATAEDTAKLEWAVRGLNDALGTSFSTAEVLTGEYKDQQGEIRNTVAAIDELIAKKQEEARINAAQDLYSEALKNEMKLKKNQSDAQKTYNEQYALMLKYYKEHKDVREHWKTAEEYAKATLASNGYGDSLNKANEALKSAQKETQAYADEMTAAQVAATEAGKAMLDFVNNNQQFAAALIDTGFSLEQLAGAAVSAGVSVDQLQAMGEQNFAALAKSAGGNTDVLIQRLKQLNQIGLDPKTFTVSDDGTIADAQGNIWDLDAQTINGKHFDVNDDGTISVAEAGIDHVDAKSISNKSFTITALDNASSTISSISAKLNRIGSRIVDVVRSVPHAQGGIRLHAQGGIYTAPTYITPYDVIGEAGAEYYDGRNIVPLTNTRYSQPFVDLIASGVVSQLGYVGYTGPSAQEIASALAQQLSGMQVTLDGNQTIGALATAIDRRGGMNVGYGY
ncbi:phage tail tape measure protein [Atopobium fossor]|uniref:phage tail tape measure protein n=1 Tax=Atopobium fossor TaxID=39487 RepID=UPI000401FC1B|nr:phage tail tape measure protein [Atopobium fossor]